MALPSITNAVMRPRTRPSICCASCAAQEQGSRPTAHPPGGLLWRSPPPDGTRRRDPSPETVDRLFFCARATALRLAALQRSPHNAIGGTASSKQPPNMMLQLLLLPLALAPRAHLPPPLPKTESGPTQDCAEIRARVQLERHGVRRCGPRRLFAPEIPARAPTPALQRAPPPTCLFCAHTVDLPPPRAGSWPRPPPHYVFNHGLARPCGRLRPLRVVIVGVVGVAPQADISHALRGHCASHELPAGRSTCAPRALHAIAACE